MVWFQCQHRIKICNSNFIITLIESRLSFFEVVITFIAG